jgi:hypothetical protein
MAADDNLQGAGLTSKEILQEVRADVKSIARSVDMLVGQNLDGRLHALEVWKEAAMLEGARAASDPSATVLGRALEAGRVANAARISKLERTVWRANGAIAMLVLLMQLLPVIIKAINEVTP